MGPELQAVARRQGGLITRRQAVMAEISERRLRTLTAVHGPWVVVRRGVYCEREQWELAGTTYDGQQQLRDRAAHLMQRSAHVLSHDSAARAMGIPMLRPLHELTHVTREGVFGTRTEHGVKHHLSRFEFPDVTSAHGLPVAGAARTAIDLAREHDVRAGVVALDHVMRHGVERADVSAELTRMRCWPHITRAREALALADPFAESIGESLLRLQVVGLGLGPVVSQFPVPLGSGTAWADLRVGCHLFEFDGRVKYQGVESGGFADRPLEQILWDERARSTRMCAHGLGMSRATFADLLPPRLPATLERFCAEFAVSCRRFGRELPPTLQEYAARIESVRQRRRLVDRRWARTA